jgi:hypothetical protein
MIVGMVDDRAIRFQQQALPPASDRRRQPRPTPQPVVPEPTPTDPFEGFAENYARFNQARFDDMVKYGGEIGSPGSRTADLLVRNNVVEDNPALRAGALVGDIGLDPGWLIPGVGAAKGVQAGARLARDPTVQARANALTGRLYHGNRNEPWNVAQSRPLDQRLSNWFSADLFSTPDYRLASSYGPDAVYNLRNLPPNLKVLDLMPGGKAVAQQSPELAKALSNLPSMGGNNPFDDVADLARHTSLTNLPGDQLRQLMQEYGFNALRHVSGQGVMAGTGRAKPVYAFFDPAGITANPISPLNRAMYQTGEVLSDIPGATRKVTERVGGRLVDSVDEALRQSSSSNPRVQQFLAERGNIAPNFTSSTGAPRRISVDPDTGRTITSAYNPYPAVSNTIQALGRPAQAVRGANQAALNAYQKALDNYQGSEVGRIQDFFRANVSGPVPSAGMLRSGFPLPPGYTPAPAPSKPGVLDFLQYLFNTSR